MAQRQRELLHVSRDTELCKVTVAKPITTPLTSAQSNGMAESFVKTTSHPNLSAVAQIILICVSL